MFVAQPAWPNKSVEFYLNALKHEDKRVRRQAAAALEVLGESRAIEPLIELLTDDNDKDVRANAARALGRIGSSQAVEPLITALADPSREVRFTAAFALGRLGDNRAVLPLCAMLEQQDLYYNVITALRRLGDARAIEPLRHTAQDDSKNPEVQYLANWALAYLEPTQNR